MASSQGVHWARHGRLLGKRKRSHDFKPLTKPNHDMTTIQAIKREIERIEKELKVTHWRTSRARLHKRLWNFQIKLANLEKADA
jgi:hypothetical protein